jgi:hypothetical protein
MRLGFFTMPLHPAHRAPSQTLQEDREAVIEQFDALIAKEIETNKAIVKAAGLKFN